jgi:hypothetical protein
MFYAFTGKDVDTFYKATRAFGAEVGVTKVSDEHPLQDKATLDQLRSNEKCDNGAAAVMHSHNANTLTAMSTNNEQQPSVGPAYGKPTQQGIAKKAQQ